MLSLAAQVKDTNKGSGVTCYHYGNSWWLSYLLPTTNCKRDVALQRASNAGLRPYSALQVKPTQQAF